MVPKQEPDTRPDINRASPEELAEIGDIGPEAAEAIVRHREQVGPLHGADDLLQIRGIADDRAQRIARQVHFY